MGLKENIYKLRTRFHLSQQAFADAMQVSRQAVQKWETGASQPDIANLMRISKYFGISVDTLLLDANTRILEELPYDKEIHPSYQKLYEWELYSSELLTEYQQCVEEGLEVKRYEPLFCAVSQMENGKYKEKMTEVLFEIVLNAPVSAAFGYNEPSDYDAIGTLLKNRAEKTEVDESGLREKIAGAWIGRICGCLLGKPIEGIRTKELSKLLRASHNKPMSRYIRSEDITPQMLDTFTFALGNRCYADLVPCAPADDDTNYTVMASFLIEKYGRDFTSADVAQMWLDSQPKGAYCTAERVAFCNFVKGYLPPDSAVYKNPYREWIGAQIRGDYFGYINPGDPAVAAQMAWRDARISHIKNGIYGEMFAAAMIAQAAVSHDIHTILYAGLGEIPSTSRLHEAVMSVIRAFDEGRTMADCLKEVHRRYDENTSHGWCHTISNAMIVTAALLYGQGDFAKSICLAVESGFDTDCNGATVGSVLGMRNGQQAIGPEWTNPLHGALDTSIFGVGRISIDALIDQTMRHIKR